MLIVVSAALNVKNFSGALGLRDVGIILRQSREGLKSVYIDDVYGTIAIGQLLEIDKLSKIVGVPAPIAEDIAKNVPDLTVIMSEIAFAKGHRLSFSLSKQIDGFGVVAIQIGQMANCETKFDVWIVCEPNLALGDKADKPGLLSKLGFGGLLKDFEAARVFSSALSHFAVPFLRLSFVNEYTDNSSFTYHLDELAIVIEVSDLSIPPNTDTPIIRLRQLRLAIIHHGPTAEAASNMTVNGSAFMTIDGCDAIAQFMIDQDAAAIDTFLAETDLPSTDMDSKDPSHDTGGFVGDVEIHLSFPGGTPTVGAIIGHIVGGLASSVGLDDIKKNVPSSLLSIFECTSFRSICVTVTKPRMGENCRISKFSACFDLQALAGSLNIFESAITFETPLMNVVILDPTLPTRSYEISVTGSMIVSTCICEISAVFVDPSNGGGDTSCLNVGIDGSRGEGGGIPIGKLLTFFVKKTDGEFSVSFVPLWISYVYI